MESLLSVPLQVPAKPFYARRTDEALQELHDASYAPLFMPQIADARILAPKDSFLFRDWYTAPSIRATGRTRQGSAVVVYAHIPNYFSDPKNIAHAIGIGIQQGAGIMPRDEFQRLIDADNMVDELGNRAVWVIDYHALKNSPSGKIKANRALEHPQTIPFLGGETRAREYLNRYRQVYGETIGNWHADDLGEEPRGRLLFLGDNDNNSLNGVNNLINDGRFLGVRPGAPQNLVLLENIVSAAHPFVPEAAQQEFEQNMRALFP